ncbi:MAG: ribonuclease P protein component [Bacteroidales bacterium]|nr:ribonuclease P protein component [Bacteroidales bacterium]
MNTFSDKTFPKSQRLCSRDDFQRLLSQKQSFYLYPFVCYYGTEEGKNAFEAKIAIAVGKKRIKRAVHRNRVKRLIKEAYRQNKHLIYRTFQEEQKEIHLILVYVESKVLPYSFINNKMILLINKLLKTYSKKIKG